MKEGFPSIHEICGNVYLRKKSFLGIKRKSLIIDIYAYSESSDKIEFYFRISTKILGKTKIGDCVSLLNTIRINGDNWQYTYFPHFGALFSLKLTFSSYNKWIRNARDIEVITEFAELKISCFDIRDIILNAMRVMNNIYIPEEKLQLLIKTAIELSSPQGLGFIHYTPTVSDELVNNALEHFEKHGELYMDYVQGRAVKMSIRKDENGIYFSAPWYDHSDSELQSLLDTLGIEAESTGEHGAACNCDTCRAKRGEGTRLEQFSDMLSGE